VKTQKVVKRRGQDCGDVDELDDLFTKWKHNSFIHLQVHGFTTHVDVCLCMIQTYTDVCIIGTQYHGWHDERDWHLVHRDFSPRF
jgi:hypothetical protein